MGDVRETALLSKKISGGIFNLGAPWYGHIKLNVSTRERHDGHRVFVPQAIQQEFSIKAPQNSGAKRGEAGRGRARRGEAKQNVEREGQVEANGGTK